MVPTAVYDKRCLPKYLRGTKHSRVTKRFRTRNVHRTATLNRFTTAVFNVQHQMMLSSYQLHKLVS